MANNVIGQFRDEIEQTGSEVVGEIKDSIDEMIEQNVTPQPTPQQVQQKEIDRQKRLAYTRKYFQDLQQNQAKVIAENKQKEQQRLQTEQQEEQVVEMKKEEKKKSQINPSVAYAGKAEFKRGVGG